MSYYSRNSGKRRKGRLSVTKEELLDVFSSMPDLETERLILRKMNVTDADAMFDYAHRESVTKYLLWLPHPNMEHTLSYLRFIQDRYRSGLFRDWAVVLKDTGRMIGTCGFTSIDSKNETGEIGYVLNPDYRGHGLAPEAARQVIRFGFLNLGLHRIEVHIMQGNDASFRVAEKLDMRFEGWHRDALLVRDRYCTIGICSILRGECNYLI